MSEDLIKLHLRLDIDATCFLKTLTFWTGQRAP